MQIVLNGQRREVDAPLTLRQLLEGLQVPATGGIAVLRNGEVARRANWEGTVVQPEDEIEIVRATVGG